jgi:hypothetical protein
LLGGPGENEQTLTETLNHLDQLDRAVFFFFCGMRIYPQTELYEIALKEGQIQPLTDLLPPVFYRSKDISDAFILQRVKAKADGRKNYLIGAGGEETAAVLSRLYKLGFTGPLWELLI